MRKKQLVTVACPRCLRTRTINKRTVGKICRSCRGKELADGNLGRIKDLVGKVFGRLTVLGRSKSETRHTKWLCSCSCGREAIVYGSNLATGHTTSCGCLSLKWNGLSNTRTYHTWRSMNDRCEKPNMHCYSYYGDRGITVCERWKHSFLNFLEDMGERPENTTLDRIDNNGNYSKENCRWSTASEQCRNRRTSRILSAFGETKTLIEWAQEKNIDSNIILRRLSKGYTNEDALTEKVNRRIYKTITAFGRTLLISDWSKETGINDAVIRERLKLGWTAEEALTKKILIS